MPRSLIICHYIVFGMPMFVELLCARSMLTHVSPEGSGTGTVLKRKHRAPVTNNGSAVIINLKEFIMLSKMQRDK